MGEQAQEKADRILAEHVVPPLSQEQQQMLDQLMDEADRLLGPSGQ
jgi:trimethylamine:corrinoid methyltransferase-like protein